MSKIIYKEESYKIIGACMEVHKKLGPGFLEKVYCEALEIEFNKADIPYIREKKLPIYYDNQLMKSYYKADFVCFDKIILEIKAAKVLVEAHIQQTLNNTVSTKFSLGLLVNFGEQSLKYKRLVNSRNS